MKKITLLICVLFSLNGMSQGPWDFKTSQSLDVWAAGTQTLTALIIADGVEITWEAAKTPKLTTTSANINVSNKIMAITLMNNSTEPVAFRAKFPRLAPATGNKFYRGSSWDEVPAGTSTPTTYYFDLSGTSDWTDYGATALNTFELQIGDTGASNTVITSRDSASTTGNTIIIEKIEFIASIPSGPPASGTVIAQASGDWNLPATWTGGAVPISTSDVEIPANINVEVTDARAANNIKVFGGTASLTVTTGGALSVTGNIFTRRFDDGVVIRSATTAGAAMGTLTLGGSVFQGNDDGSTTTTDRRVTIRKTLTNDNWYLLSQIASKQPRVNRMTGSDLRTNATPAYSIGVYNSGNAVNSKYDYFSTTLANTDEVSLGAGMSVSVSGTGNTNTTGEFENKAFYSHGASVDIAISVDGGTSDAFNLVGNPFLANLYGNDETADAVNNVLTVNTGVLAEETLWFWNGDTSSWVTKNQSSAAFTIPPLTGFFVKSSVAGGNFTFTESMETHTGAGSIASKTASNRFEIDLSIESGEIKRSSSIRYIDGTSTSFDNGYDSSIFGGYASELELYTGLLDGDASKKLAIQSLPNGNFEDMIIPVGVRAAVNSEITFKALVSNMPKGHKLYLEDRLQGTFTRLDEADGAYKVTLADAATDGRFFLHTRATSVLSLDSEFLNSVSIYTTNNTNLRITGLKQGNVSVKLFNVLGKQVMVNSFTAINSVENVSLPTLARGIYVVQLETENGKLNKKIIIE